MKNERDYSGKAFKQGRDAEEKFVELVERLGWDVVPANSYQNSREGWDFLIEKPERTHKVEVKAQKRISRQDEETQNEYIWIELKNINGNAGWLYKQADVIAFQHDEGFWLISRPQLAKRVENLVTEKTVDKSSDALYNKYSRRDRNDELTMIRYSDIEDLATKWK